MAVVVSATPDDPGFAPIVEVAVPSASVLTGYGPPEVLRWREVRPLEPAAGQIRLRVRAAGVGPADLAIRRGNLQEVFPLPADAVLGFEAAGIVDAVGDGVDRVAVGDEVAAWLPGLGGYDEHALASAWTIKPPGVSFVDAAALPASVEAAVGVLGQLGVRLSAPTPDRAPRAVDDGMALLAAGTLRMKQRRGLPLQDAAEAHRLLESGATHDKLVLVARTH